MKLKINKISISKIIKITIRKKNWREKDLWIFPVEMKPASKLVIFHFSSEKKKRKKFISAIKTNKKRVKRINVITFIIN